MSLFDPLSSIINSVFGTSIVYSYSNGSPDSQIKGVFDNAFVEVNNISTRKPILKNVSLNDLTSEPVEGDYVTINSVVYSVIDSQPDSFGTTTLILEKS